MRSYHDYLVGLQNQISDLHDAEIIDDFTFRRLEFPIKMVMGYMRRGEEHEMIWKALNWAYNNNGTQGAIDLAEAMEIGDDRDCIWCETSTPHLEDCCVVCGIHEPID